MGRVCTICAHSKRATIDAVLETDRSLRDIAAQFGVSKTALHRHWQAHLSEGQPVQPPSRLGVTTTARGRRLWTCAKWGLLIGIGVLVVSGWVARDPYLTPD